MHVSIPNPPWRILRRRQAGLAGSRPCPRRRRPHGSRHALRRRSVPTCERQNSAVRKAIGNAAASSALISCGRRCTRSAGNVTNDARQPFPTAITSSPGRRWLTPGPARVTTPAHSAPIQELSSRFHPQHFEDVLEVEAGRLNGDFNFDQARVDDEPTADGGSARTFRETQAPAATPPRGSMLLGSVASGGRTRRSTRRPPARRATCALHSPRREFDQKGVDFTGMRTWIEIDAGAI